MKKLAIIALIVGLFYLPTLLIIQSGNKTIGSYTTEDVWENNAYIKNGLSYSDVFGHNVFGNKSTNMIVDGDFSNNLSNGWTIYNGDKYVQDQEFTGYQSTYSNHWVLYHNDSAFVDGATTEKHKYYLSYDIKSNVILDQIDSQMYQGEILGYQRDTDYEDLEINTWKTISHIYDIEDVHTKIIIQVRPYIYGEMLLTDYINIDNIILYDLSVLYGIGQEPSIEEFERDLQIFKDRVGEPSYGGYEHKTDNLTDVDGWDLGDAKVESLFKFMAQPFTVINKARVQGAEYIGDWTYDTVVKPLVNLGNTLSENIQNYIDGLWLDIYGLGEDIKDALYKIWDGATFWN